MQNTFPKCPIFFNFLPHGSSVQNWWRKLEVQFFYDDTFQDEFFAAVVLKKLPNKPAL